MNASRVIYALLSSNAPLAAVIGTNIFAKVAPQSAQPPLVVYEEVDANLQQIIDMSAPRLWSARIQITAIAADYATVKAALAAATNACNYARGQIAGVTVASIVFDSIGSDGFDADVQLFEQSCDVMVTYNDDGS